jgi:diguanylate cyclase (GGDEF)-like protein
VPDVTAGPSHASRQEPGGQPARRTWRLLIVALLTVVLAVGFEAVRGGALLDWVALAGVGLAFFAAVAHRNIIVALESRGRAEAENFARILRGLARSVSADSIVGAIVDDLAEGTGADHVVVVRRRPDGAALDATLVTRRAGVPNSRTVLPLGDLFTDDPADAPEPIAIPIATGGAPVDPSTFSGRAAVGMTTASAAAVGRSVRVGDADRRSGPRESASGGRGRRRTDRSTSLVGRLAGLVPGLADRAGGVGGWFAGLFADVGLVDARRARGTLVTARSEVVGTGSSIRVAARIAERVRTIYGLSHTLAAPLLTDGEVIGAIVLARRDREPWPEPARRLLKAAADEAAAALARALTFREAEANAATDPLTGLPNRRYFDEFCGLLARRRRTGDAVAVLMVDIDHFKTLNDTYGHPVGDEVLREVAAAIVSAVREEDVPARVGGEEFAVLLRNPGPEVAFEVGERVRASVRALDLSSLGVPGVSVSVGVANALGADEPIPAIVDRADRALYQAKRGGRDRVIAA